MHWLYCMGGHTGINFLTSCNFLWYKERMKHLIVLVFGINFNNILPWCGVIQTARRDSGRFGCECVEMNTLMENVVDY